MAYALELNITSIIRDIGISSNNPELALKAVKSDLIEILKIYYAAAFAQEKVPETVREHYEFLGHFAGDSIQCGACETKCPLGVLYETSFPNRRLMIKPLFFNGQR